MRDHTPTAVRDLPELTTTLVEISRQLHAQVSEVAMAPPVRPEENGSLVYLEGLPEINRAIRGAVEGARTQILTAQPDGPRTKSVLTAALETVRAQLDAGVANRTLYQHSARFDEATKEYVRQVTEYGAEVRTLPEFFERLIIVDGTVAFIPGRGDRTRALRITEPSMVRFLKDVFERSWDRAEAYPFVPARSVEAAPEVIPSLHESIKQLLIAGHSDRAIARRLGISERSLQTHVGRIKAHYGAENRLQLGYLLGRATT
ncbi:LuxR C-terminal-related transcriptional regulator [Streptomyces sp. NPDC006551]|uniref:LuxR C-terminal-related transcriptional regulator n=1 Tax=Streptomyces sp. NPDC006551 TaxID=3157178 RepID=UPI0033A1A2D4